jgi:hypothetical protein
MTLIKDDMDSMNNILGTSLFRTMNVIPNNHWNQIQIYTTPEREVVIDYVAEQLDDQML